MQLKLCAVDGTNNGYFKTLLSKLDIIEDKSYYKKVPIYDRVLLYIKNYSILKGYVRVAFFLKSIMKVFSL